MKQPIEIVNQFKNWCDENLKSAVGLRRTSLELFNETMNNSYSELKRLTKDDCDHTSFACGVAAGIKMMTLPENE